MWSFTVAVRPIRRNIADELRRAEDHVTKDCNLFASERRTESCIGKRGTPLTLLCKFAAASYVRTPEDGHGRRA